MNKIQLPDSFRVLAESRNFFLGHRYEVGFLIHKTAGQRTYLGDYYGDPDFGIIDQNENWALLCGEGCYLWTPNGLLHLNKEIPEYASLFHSPFAARQENASTIQFLDGPLGGNPTAYSFDIKTRQVKKMPEVPYSSDPSQWNIDPYFW